MSKTPKTKLLINGGWYRVYGFEITPITLGDNVVIVGKKASPKKLGIEVRKGEAAIIISKMILDN